MAAASADSVRVTMPDGRQGEIRPCSKHFNIVVMGDGEQVIVDKANLCAMLEQQGKARAA